MVATVDEIRWLRAMFDEVVTALRTEDPTAPEDLQVG